MKNNNDIINALKILSVDQINQANSGHPGIAIGCAPILYELFTNHINTNPDDTSWINRDRFVLSAGHGSSLLYSILHLTGHKLTIEDLKNFRKIGLTPGHPEYKHTPGVEITTGPLGQGIANSVGMALAQKHMASVFNTKDIELLDNYTYCLCGDGDLQEGVALESISLAGKLQLNKLIVLYDSNNIQLDGPTSLACSDNYKLIFSGYNWNYIYVENGSDTSSIAQAIDAAKRSNRPTIIEFKTIIGKDSPNENTSKVHGSPLGKEGRDFLANKIGWEYEPFNIPIKVYNHFNETYKKRSLEKYNHFNENLKMYKQQNTDLYNKFISYFDDIKIDYKKYLKLVDVDKISTRKCSGIIMDVFGKDYTNLIGGSADLIASTQIKGQDGDFSNDNLKGRNIRYGVREHAMGAINNGILAYGGLRSFGSGFFVFSDYVKPSVRLSALMNMPQVYIFSHDSIAVGEDGPTHQPVEQLTGLRAIPNLNVVRPCDYRETLGAIKLAFESKTTPHFIATSRQDLTNTYNTDVEMVSKGGYILKKEENKLDGIIISCGSEIDIVMQSLKILNKYDIRVVSMPSIDLFLNQDLKYQEEILPKDVDILSVEAGSSLSWYKFSNNVLGIDSFGKSANIKDVLKLYKMTPEDVAEKFIKIKEGN